MAEEVIATIRKNAREEIRIGLQKWKGSTIASVRVWYRAEDGTMRPGKDGLNFRTDLVKAMAEAMKELGNRVE